MAMTSNAIFYRARGHLFQHVWHREVSVEIPGHQLLYSILSWIIWQQMALGL